METWSVGARKKVFVILFLVAALSASHFTFDWTLYFLGIVDHSHPNLPYSRIVKLLTSLLIMLLALTAGKEGLDVQDARRLRMCFPLLFAGDLLFLLDEFSPVFDNIAILSFLAGHVMVILRNGQGLRAHLRESRRPARLRWDLATALGIVGFTAVMFRLTLYDRLAGNPLFYVMIAYAAVLATSTWTGWAAVRIGRFPRKNALMIALGATCFFLGDYLVGFNLALPPGLERTTTLYLTWIFYAPAIFLFALSAYRWGGKAPAAGGLPFHSHGTVWDH